MITRWRKTIVLVTITILFIIFLCACNSEISTGMHYADNEYFAFDDDCFYDFSYSSLIPISTESDPEEEVVLECIKIRKMKNGLLYQLIIKTNEDYYGRFYGDWDRFNLGYYYVTDNDIIMLRNQPIQEMTEDEMNERGTVVLQKFEKSDNLREYEKGVHEIIEQTDDINTYWFFDNSNETGYYEVQMWKKGKGLVYYISGWGAMRDHIELLAIDERVLLDIPDGRVQPLAFQLLKER